MSARWLLTILAVAPALVQSCGMSTHNEVTERALAWLASRTNSSVTDYRAIAEAYPGHVQAGSFFPDWGYGCFSNDDPAEDAHWPIYQRAFLEYIMENYKRPWSKEAQKAIAFLFGIVSHSVADISWHSLGIAEGFIPQIARSNILNEYNTGHSVADAGAEFVLRRMSDLDYLGVPFQVPIKFVKGAYEKLGRSIKTTQLALCMTQGYAGAIGNKIAGQYIYPFYAYKSPALVELYESYFIGGLNDMAGHTAECLKKVGEWLDNGQLTRPHCAIEENQWNRGGGYLNSFTDDSGNARIHVQSRRSKILEIGSKLTHAVGKGVQVLVDGVKAIISDDDVDGDLTVSLDDSSSSSLSDWSASKVADWVIEHMSDLKLDVDPTRLRQYILNGEYEEALPIPIDTKCQASSSASSSRSLKFETSAEYAGLGRALALGDFDGDGVKELAVGAPFYSPGTVLVNIQQAGAVFIVRGDKKPSATKYQLPKDALASLYGNVKMGRFGYALAVVDINGDGVDDLAVASPSEGAETLAYRGRVQVYLGQKGLGLSATPYLEISGLDPGSFNGVNYNYRHTVLGTKLFAADLDLDGFKDLVIGAPFASPDSADSQEGRVYAFLSSSFHSGVKLCSAADWTLPPRGPARQLYSHFGASMSIIDSNADTPMLVVGAPGYSFKGKYTRPQSAGAVFAYRLGRAEPTSEEFALMGTAENAQLGGSVAYLGQGLLAVSSPSESTDDQGYIDKEESGKSFQIPPSGWHRGAVRVVDITQLWQGRTLSIPANGTDVVVRSVVRGQRSGARFGFQLVASGSNLVKDLWATEPWAFYEKGRIFKFEGSSIQLGTSEAVQISSQCVRGDVTRGKFGSNLLVEDINGDGSDDVVATLEHADDGARLSGIVEITLS